jgi:hypothetical protein
MALRNERYQHPRRRLGTPWGRSHAPYRAPCTRELLPVGSGRVLVQSAPTLAGGRVDCAGTSSACTFKDLFGSMSSDSTPSYE